MIQRLIARFLGIFPEVRHLREQSDRNFAAVEAMQRAHNTRRDEWDATTERISLKLHDTERALSIMTEARLNVDRSFEFLKGEVEALKEAHSREVDGLKRTIDAFAPSAIGRTVFGLAPEPKPMAIEPQPQGSVTRRTSNAEALAKFYEEAAQRVAARQGLHPNPNGDTAADFTKQ